VEQRLPSAPLSFLSQSSLAPNHGYHLTHHHKQHVEV
jgi:hypothetical protein